MTSRSVPAPKTGADGPIGITPSAAALEALDEAVRGIAGVLDVERVLQLIVDRVRALVGARYAALGIVHPGEEYLERFITSGLGRAERDAIGPLPRGHGFLGIIIREGRALRIPDIALDDRRVGFPANHPPMHSFLGVPVTIRGRPMGNFYLTEKTGASEFSEADQRLTEMFALHAGIAIDNARLHTQVQHLAVIAERARIGRDLHDGIIQAIYGVGLSLEDMPELIAADPDEAAARVDHAIESLNVVIRDIRNFIFGLRPELMETAGLIEGLASLVDESRINTTIYLELVTEGVDGLELPADRRTQLFQVVREALSNVARHSAASRATIRLERLADEFIVTISDNGIGFGPDDDRGPGHRGLINMATRVSGLGGEMIVESQPGAGTRLTIRVPIPRPDDEDRESDDDADRDVDDDDTVA